MKKLFIMTLCIVAVVMFSACSSNEKPIDTQKNPTTITPTEEGKENSPTEEVKPTEEIKNVTTIKIPRKDIYIDCRESYRVQDEPRTSVMYESHDWLVGFTFNKSDIYEGNLDEVVEYLNKDFLSDISTFTTGYLKESKIQITSSKNTVIGGFESIVFEGTVFSDVNSGWDCHVYGYSFIIDGIPCAVIGVVSAEEQDAAMIEATNKEVDAIAATIRTTK